MVLIADLPSVLPKLDVLANLAVPSEEITFLQWSDASLEVRMPFRTEL